MNRGILVAVVLLGSVPAAGVAGAEGDEDGLLSALTSGTVKLDMRFRWENANIDAVSTSNAVTLRTRLGYGTRPYHGFSAYADFENIVAIDDNAYWDGVGANTRSQSIIADPEESEVNQAFAKWSSDGLTGDGAFARSKTSIMGGRQRIILDDARFIGNVGWRQNEQTFDAAVARSAFGVDGLSTTYGYIFDVNRIFGDNGPVGAGTRDFRSDSHILNATWSGFEPLAVTGFAYLLKFGDSAANSSDTWGFRANGKHAFNEEWSLAYAGSYARQSDGENNPANYEANYYSIEGVVGWSRLGSVTLGYEVLGSDSGRAQFRTPLATAHKFNGWADVFLDNGGAIGLEDLYVAVAPKLPWGLNGKLVYHSFDSNRGSVDYGDEIDGVISKKFYDQLTVLAKFAYYDAGLQGRADRHRIWLETTFAF